MFGMNTLMKHLLCGSASGQFDVVAGLQACLSRGEKATKQKDNTRPFSGGGGGLQRHKVLTNDLDLNLVTA